MFLRGLQDMLISNDHMLSLKKKAVNAKFIECIECEDGEHNDTIGIVIDEYLVSLINFLE